MPTETDRNLRQYIIGVLIILTTTTVLGATGWNFTKVAEIPDLYMKKSEIQHFMQINREDHIIIEQKLDRLLELLMAHRSTEDASYTYNDINEEGR